MGNQNMNKTTPLKNQTNLPFQNLKFENWLNLAIASVLVFYLVQFGFDLLSPNKTNILAYDYRAYWIAGRIANDLGYSKIYSQELLGQFASANAKELGLTLPIAGGIPFPYLPLFVIPFQLLAMLNFSNSFLVWSIFNIFAFLGYLNFFYKDITGKKIPIRLVLLFFISLPLYMDLCLGQVNIYLMIIVGEYIRMTISDKPFRAGVWLGGLSLKPQLFIIIIPFIFLRRQGKTSAGFCLSSLVIGVISMIFLQKEGIISYLSNLLGFSGLTEATGTNIMMNWGMVAYNLTYFVNPLVGWIAAIAGTLVTIAVTIYLLKKLKDPAPTMMVVCIMVSFAATNLLTWHSHLSTVMVLFPALIYLSIKKQISDHFLAFWIFLPILVWFNQYIVGTLVATNFLSLDATSVQKFLYGLAGLILNISLIIWAGLKFKPVLEMN